MSRRESSCCMRVEYQMALGFHWTRVRVWSVLWHPSAPTGCVFGMQRCVVRLCQTAGLVRQTAVNEEYMYDVVYINKTTNPKSC